jgi:7-keto-8-aminopelargonate synthetase-like enzyme
MSAARIPAAALSGSLKDFRMLAGTDILGRTGSFFEWQAARRQAGLWQYGRATIGGPQPECTIVDDSGVPATGVNFASQDYLSLASHPSVKAAAVAAIERYGVHSAGSPALVGNTDASVSLERKLSQFLETEHVLLFPTGWAAGFGVVKAFVRPADHVVMDNRSHACLLEGAMAATKNLQLHDHLDVAAAARMLRTQVVALDTVATPLRRQHGLAHAHADRPRGVYVCRPLQHGQ